MKALIKDGDTRMATKETASFKDTQLIPTTALMPGSWQRTMAEDCGWRFYGVYDESALQAAHENIVSRVAEVEAGKRLRAQQSIGELAVAA